MRSRKQDTTKVEMVNDRQTGASSSFFSNFERRSSTKQPAILVDQLDKGKISTQQKPHAKMTSKTASTLWNNSLKSARNYEDSDKKYSRFPPLPTKSSSTSRKAKVSFPPSQPLEAHRRRLSVPEESMNCLPKSILKKRLSVSMEFNPPAPQKEQADFSVLWSLPWERELYFPPVTHNGMLVFLDEDGSLPPMLRRLSNTDTYHYSQEFLQVLDELKDRPTS
ncbi:uncharacterized protein LOC130275963 [Hyla sarda]|uniref:uncharacterized protein LOC130275963 n=1 Tax=Hyla sarda TaxID=327740 RepID=UPI0024C30E4F|nr:uncharacterized protein LOC130275963 [Hyla sarda]